LSPSIYLLRASLVAAAAHQRCCTSGQTTWHHRSDFALPCAHDAAVH